MKRILTAINNPILNEELRKKEYIEVIGKDIQYKEGIIETIDRNKKIDIIIISDELPGEIGNKQLLENIKNKNEKIKIIYILEKENVEKENELKKLNINSIYYNDKITLKKIINIISDKEINKEEEMKKEIEELKKIIEKNNILINKKISKKINDKINKKISNKINDKINRKINNKINNKKNKINKSEIESKIKKNNKIKLENKFRKNNNKEKIIKIIGQPKTGKTTIAFKITEKLAKKDNKILLIDLDKINKTLTNKILLKNNKIIKLKNKKNKIKNIKIKEIKNKTKKIKLKKYNKINCKIKDLKKINKNIFLLNIKNKKQKHIIKEIEKYEIFFDYIIVDTKKREDLKIIDDKCKNIIVIEGKTLGVQELKGFIEIIKKSSHKAKKDLHIVVNKTNKNTIMRQILRQTLNHIETITYIKEKKFIINKYKINKLI